MKNSNIPPTESRAALPSVTLHLVLGYLACSLQLAAVGSIIEITTPSRYSIPETAQHATVTLSRTGNAETDVSVTVSTEDIAATSGFDYTPMSLVVTFSPGQTQAIVHVPIQNDGLVEKAETFSVSVSSPSPPPPSRTAPPSKPRSHPTARSSKPDPMTPQPTYGRG